MKFASDLVNFYNKVDKRPNLFDCKKSEKEFTYVEAQCRCSIKTFK